MPLPKTVNRAQTKSDCKHQSTSDCKHQSTCYDLGHCNRKKDCDPQRVCGRNGAANARGSCERARNGHNQARVENTERRDAIVSDVVVEDGQRLHDLVERKLRPPKLNKGQMRDMPPQTPPQTIPEKVQSARSDARISATRSNIAEGRRRGGNGRAWGG